MDELLIALRDMSHSVRSRLAPPPGTFARRLWDKLRRKPEPRWVITMTPFAPPDGIDVDRLHKAAMAAIIEACRLHEISE